MTTKPGYKAVVDVLNAHSDWEHWGSDEQYDAALKKAATVGGGELFYQHTETGGQLSLANMGYGTTGELGQTLDMNFIAGEQTPMKDALEAAYDRIAAEHETAYTSRPEGVVAQISFGIPYEYDPAEIERTIDAINGVSRDVQHLHDDILSPLEQ